MDPLTHTLVGANLASTRLGTRTRLATAACLIGANAPDVDVSAYFLGEDFAIGFRRGWTHGLLALVVLPIVLWLALLLWHRFRLGISKSASEVPLRPGWLFALCWISVLTHPFLDWLNVYGMRWLMPFDDTWFYGDSVFIMDPWLWLVLASAWLVPRRRSRLLLTVWVGFAGLLFLVVAGRAPVYLPAIAIVALALLAALWWNPEDDHRTRFGAAGLLVASIYIGGMIGLHGATERRVREHLQHREVVVQEIVVGPLPIDSLRWDVLVGSEDHYRYGTWSWWSRELRLVETKLPAADASEIYLAASSDPSIAGFMSWARHPWYETEAVDDGIRVWIMDARYSRSRQLGFGGVSVIVD